jgi:hypothetical protein
MKQLSIEEIAEVMNMTEEEVEETLDSAMLKILQVFKGSKLSEKQKISILLDVLNEQNYGNSKR